VIDTASSRRFVILRHEGVARPHFDLMIESQPGGPLETWRSDVWPIEMPTPLVHLPPHRRAYLDYEGPVSNDRGFVRRVETGTCTVQIARDGCWTVVARSIGRAFTLTLRPVKEGRWQGEI
jgi:hypothetical protein